MNDAEYEANLLINIRTKEKVIAKCSDKFAALCHLAQTGSTEWY